MSREARDGRSDACTGMCLCHEGQGWPERRLHRDVLMPRRPGMAESGACTEKCLCHEGQGWPRVALAQESAYVTKARDGREWLLHRKVLMSRRPGMAGATLAQERVHAAKARSSIYTRTQVAKSRQETKMPAGNSGRYCLQAFICMVARGRFELPTPAL